MTGPRPNTEHSSRAALRADSAAREFAAPGAFLQMLSRERKRAERSGKSFLLGLLDTTDIRNERGVDGVLREIPSAVLSTIRETDLGGWYQEHSVAGIIFTEVGAPNQRVAESVLLARLTAALHRRISAQYVDRIRISFLFFPQERGGRRMGYSGDESFYADLLREADRRRLPHMLKRSMDVIGSLMALIALSPAFAMISAAIKLTSKGPVLFRQERVGQYGVPFTFLKFRSMRVSNDASIHKEYVKRFISGRLDKQTAEPQRIIYKIMDDPRVTVVGKILRKSSLDELPQFWNVLTGKMSLVGPRPPIPYELENYDLWHLRRVLEAKPGITGLWQVSGRSRLTFDEMVRLDLRYAKTWSPWLDLKILLRTPGAVVSGKGAY
jgi:lipopolysaccharide/colanic/teichoic acid biosynthesis glycosyltransferase